ncbi:MAG: heme peroxidase family protein [Kiloniellales bacterium]
MLHHGVAEPRGQRACDRQCRHHPDPHGYTNGEANGEGRFGRLFSKLAPAYLDPAHLRDLGKKGGIMDSGAIVTKSTTVTLGFVFLGQFIDHDITLDVTSSLERRNDPLATRNFRTPALDLDCVYGSGPEASPFLYDPNQPAPFTDKMLLIGQGGIDLPRIAGKAIIGDPRNDENRVISQLQLAFLKFHNAAVQSLAGTVPDGELFEAAERLVRWHYQWIILTEFLPRMIGPALTDDILCNGRRHYCFEGRPFIPIEFSAAAYRFGHSMVPNRLAANGTHGDVELFGPELGTGFTPVADADGTIEWSRFFDTGAGLVQFADKLDGKLASDLLELEFVAQGEKSLATRNMLRGQSFGLPSGQAVAEAMGEMPLTASELGLSGVLGDCTPLWFYILKEAELRTNGEHLGPVGGRIVGEVLVGLMDYDQTSLLSEAPNWQPTLPRRNGTTTGPFTIGDLLHVAGVA